MKPKTQKSGRTSASAAKKKQGSRKTNPSTREEAPQTGADLTQTRNESANVVVEFPPFSDEAWAYVTADIPGADPLILYTGMKVPIEVSKLVGHSLTLEETQHMVGLDGEQVKCSSEGKMFQPVKYLPFTPGSLRDELAAGVKFTDVELPYGGSFYTLPGEKEPLAYSGTVYVFDEREEAYKKAWASPLVIAADTLSELTKRRGRVIWAVCRDSLGRISQKRKEVNDRRQRIKQQMTKVATAKRFNSVDDAFQRNGHKK